MVEIHKQGGNEMNKLFGVMIVVGGLLGTVLEMPVRAADVKMTGLIFGQYNHYLSDSDMSGTANMLNRSEFTISRIYMNAEAKFSPTIKSKIVLEGNSTTAGNAVFVKNAFMEWAVADEVNVFFGLIGTPWIGFEEGIWGRRFVKKTYQDEEGILKSADKGIGLGWKLPGGYGDLHAVYVNGEGNSAVELAANEGRFKDVLARMTIIPLPGDESLSGLKLHAYIQQGQVKGGAFQARHRMIGALSYQAASYHLMASYVTGQDGSGTADVDLTGFSVHGSIKPLKDVGVFGRMDSYKKSTTEYTRYTVGVDQKLAEGVRISLNDQMEVPTSGKTYENQVLAQVELKF